MEKRTTRSMKCKFNRNEQANREKETGRLLSSHLLTELRKEETAENMIKRRDRIKQLYCILTQWQKCSKKKGGYPWTADWISNVDMDTYDPIKNRSSIEALYIYVYYYIYSIARRQQRVRKRHEFSQAKNCDILEKIGN